MNNNIIVIFLLFLTNCKTNQTGTKLNTEPIIISGFTNPESVCQDGNSLYVANISGSGKKGYISKVNLADPSVKDTHFLPADNQFIQADGPMGTIVVGNSLYMVCGNLVIGFNLKTRQKIFEFNVPDTSRLNDLCYVNGSLYLSSTDLGNIFELNLKNKSCKPLITDENERKKLNGINGLVYDAKRNRFFATANKNNTAPSSLIMIDFKTKRIDIIFEKEKGLFLDGMTISDQSLYFVNWNKQLFSIVISKLTEGTVLSPIKDIALPSLIVNSEGNGTSDIILSRDKKNYIYTLFSKGQIVISPVKIN
ncbi:hypothetical protein [Chryseobacterium sp. JM1]|uniref:hypothetical protein n=1 Tax=Chryseobacterium sp. JM1 TaxID=1233950 RepID=UPI0004E75FFC|nr:hypothetical protein [Chryseobacterium sp. JM1]KFF15317.1 hypothetical protein IW22_24365 [Chryseobacterium sp. JM1]